MRIYTAPMEMIREVERDLVEMGTRYQTATVQDKNVAGDAAFQTIELSGYSYCLTQWDQVGLREMLCYPGINNRLDWAIEEAEERVQPIHGNMNPGRAWMRARNVWEQFLRDGKFSYTYAERWNWQIPYVVSELRERPNTRQAIMTMYSAERDIMNWGGRDRVPCSLTYHFMIREGKLILIYSQRSCDFMNFFAPDVYFSLYLLGHIADLIDVPTGQFIHNLNSLHAFKGDMDAKGRSIF